MSRYTEILQGLNEALAYEKGNLKNVLATNLTIEGVHSFSASEIKAIRVSANMTQDLFALVLGVSKNTVLAWEAGKTSPSNTAKRLIGLIAKNPNFAVDNKIIVSEAKG